MAISFNYKIEVVSKVIFQIFPEDILFIIIIKWSFSYTFPFLGRYLRISLSVGRYLRISLSTRRERARVRGRKWNKSITYKIKFSAIFMVFLITWIIIFISFTIYTIKYIIYKLYSILFTILTGRLLLSLQTTKGSEAISYASAQKSSDFLITHYWLPYFSRNFIWNWKLDDWQTDRLSLLHLINARYAILNTRYEFISCNLHF